MHKLGLTALALALALGIAGGARADDGDLERRLRALEDENARLRRDLGEAVKLVRAENAELRKDLAGAARHLREIAELLERAAEPSPSAPPPASGAKPPPITTEQQSDPLFGPLYRAHGARDEKAIAAAERARRRPSS